MPLKGFIAGAVTNLLGSGINAWSQYKANEANIAAQERINKANLEHSNYWNTKNYELASEAWLLETIDPGAEELEITCPALAGIPKAVKGEKPAAVASCRARWIAVSSRLKICCCIARS